MSDIVERLRLLVPSDSSGAAFDAVNEIDALRAENKRLRAALMYAAKELELLYFFAISNGIAEAGVPPHVKARAALEESKG